MRIITSEQNTPAWECARKGRITASAISKVMAGKHTKGRFEYMMNLILDLEGVDNFGDTAPWFEKGRRFEKFALGWYQYETGTNVRRIGFALHDKFDWLGASTDGLIDPDGNLEIKYRDNLETFEAACTKTVSKAYDDQMQMEMAVCNRQWTDYLNYWRSEDGKKEQGHIRRIVRDDGKIRELEDAALSFWHEVMNTYRKRSGIGFIHFPFEDYKGAK